MKEKVQESCEPNAIHFLDHSNKRSERDLYSNLPKKYPLH